LSSRSITTTLRTRILSALFGFDFFISYRRDESSSYAEALYRELSRQKFICYLDREEIVGGVPLSATLLKALRRSRYLVPILTPGAVESEWMKVEIRSFEACQDHVLSISAAGFLSGVGPLPEPFEALRERVWVDETSAAVRSGVPSTNVVDFIRRTRTRMKVATIGRLSAAGAAALSLVAIVTLALVVSQRNDREALVRASRLIDAANSHSAPASARSSSAKRAIGLAEGRSAETRLLAENALRQALFDQPGVELFSRATTVTPASALPECAREPVNVLANSLVIDRAHDALQIWNLSHIYPKNVCPPITLKARGGTGFGTDTIDAFEIDPSGTRLAVLQGANAVPPQGPFAPAVTIWQLGSHDRRSREYHAPMSGGSWLGDVKWLAGGNLVATSHGYLHLDRASVATVSLGGWSQRLSVSADRTRALWWTSTRPEQDFANDPFAPRGQQFGWQDPYPIHELPQSWIWSLWERAGTDLRKIEERKFQAPYRAWTVQLSSNGCFAAFVPERAIGPPRAAVVQLPCNGATSSVVREVQLEGSPTRGRAEDMEMVFSPNGRFLAIVGNGAGAHLLDLQTLHRNTRTQMLPGPTRLVPSLKGRPVLIQSASSAAFSPDGSRLAIGDENSVLIWRMNGTAHLAAPELNLSTDRHSGGALEFSPDGRFLKSEGKEILVWDLALGGAQPAVLRAASEDAMFYSHFTPDGRGLIRITRDYTDLISATVWALRLKDMKAMAARNTVGVDDQAPKSEACSSEAISSEASNLAASGTVTRRIGSVPNSRH
jgi:WD40 repeat protein